ncbi:MAG: outer membrane beta-barrel protein [Brumimicrobium sp.]
MKKTFLYILVLFCFPIYGQQDNLSQIINEIDVSVNRTVSVNNTISVERFGVGLGVKHVFFKPKKINLISGMEYNLNRFEIDYFYEGHYAHSTDVFYTLHNLSIPLYFRLNFGNETKFFFETGGFLDFIFNASRSGTRHISSSNQTGEKEVEFNERASLYSTINYGGSMGVGLSFPLNKYRMFIKPDYKLGFVDLNSASMTSITNSSIRLSVGIHL